MAPKGIYDVLSVSLGRRLGFNNARGVLGLSAVLLMPSALPPQEEPSPAPQTLGCRETCAAFQVRRGKRAVKEPSGSQDGGQILHLSEPQFSNL